MLETYPTTKDSEMKPIEKHQVTFYSPGTFVSESSTYDIESWDTAKAVELSEKVKERYGAKPYGFVFETLLTMPNIPSANGDSFSVQPKLKERSGIHFLGGKLETYDDVVNRNDPKENILRSNMRYNEEARIVCINTNSYKSTIPFSEKDCIVDAQGKIIERGDDPKHVAYRKRVAEQLKDD